MSTDPFPTITQVETATHEELIRWNRFCGYAETPEEEAAVARILERLRLLQQQDSQEYHRASAKVGWGHTK